jgi:RNA polymerase sigma-70 factor (ECF subfamily)
MSDQAYAAGPIGWDWTWARALCLREAQRVLGRNAAAEDAAQEAVIRAWRQRARCRTPERPDPWIATIARREALRLAAGDRERPLEDVSGGEAPSPEASVVLRADVHRALATLDPRDRRLLAARYWGDLTHVQSANCLGLPVGTVKVRLHRLTGRLREILDEP